MDVRDLPALNAALNTVATVLLTLAFIAIKQGRVQRHKRLMLGATGVSAAFLASYLYYHYQVGSVRFTEQGIARTIYFAILIPHVVLAAVQVPLILATLWFALRGTFERHRKVARITWPVWMFVSVTGVLVYFMLYQWFPSAELAAATPSP